MVGRRDFLKRSGAGAAAAVIGKIPPAEMERDGDRNGSSVPEIKHSILLLVDRSGSMGTVREATIDGLNKYIDDQRDKADLYLTLLQFDALPNSPLTITKTFVDVPAPSAPILTSKDFVPRGGTPLYAAIVSAIADLEKTSGPNSKNLVAIQTDGFESDSPPEFTLEVVKEQIKAKEALGNWTFLFLGADIDAFGAGSSIGVASGNTNQYANSLQGITASYAATSTGTRGWYEDKKNLRTNTFYSATTASAADTVAIETKT